MEEIIEKIKAMEKDTIMTYKALEAQDVRGGDASEGHHADGGLG